MLPDESFVAVSTALVETSVLPDLSVLSDLFVLPGFGELPVAILVLRDASVLTVPPALVEKPASIGVAVLAGMSVHNKQENEGYQHKHQ